MTWALRRRLIIVLIIIAVIGGAVFYSLTPTIFRAPSCTDGIKNGTETGIDCGGTMCANLCVAEVKVPTVLWARSFPVTDNVYNAIAYVENKNNAATRAIPYEFRLYDANSIFIARVDGTALIPPLGRYAIVETGIQSGSATVARTTFEFSNTPAVWERVSKDIQDLKVMTSKSNLDTTGLVPRLTATVTNPSPTARLNNTVIAAILYDANDNAVNVSKTVVPALLHGESAPIFFTWPRALAAPVVRYELVPIIDIFHTE